MAEYLSTSTYKMRHVACAQHIQNKTIFSSYVIPEDINIRRDIVRVTLWPAERSPQQQQHCEHKNSNQIM